MNKTSIAIILALLFVVILIMGYFRIKILSYENSQLHGQINALANASREENKRYQQAHKEAQQSLKKSEEKIEKIIKTNVPTDCQLVINWGIKEAKGFKR